MIALEPAPRLVDHDQGEGGRVIIVKGETEEGAAETDPTRGFPKWRYDILTRVILYKNDILVFPLYTYDRMFTMHTKSV